MKLPKLPELLERKIYKTGQTRGADDDVIFQNRVGRNSTVLIPYAFWNASFKCPPGEKGFENGYIVLISPDDYFEKSDTKAKIIKSGLKLGVNALVFYETRRQWDRHNPEKLGWQPAQKRNGPLGGKYVARVPATTAATGGEKVVRGFTSTSGKGAGIRVYEYASTTTIQKSRAQLEALFWQCRNAEEVSVASGMSEKDAATRKAAILKHCATEGLLDFPKMIAARVVNKEQRTVCPLCLEELTGAGFLNRMQQAAGREVPDLTVTEINLFHVEELRVGIYNHRPYNLGWGHHHCNVVTKDTGIKETLRWMEGVLRRNIDSGYLDPAKRAC